MVEDIICFRNNAPIQPKLGAIFRYYHNIKQHNNHSLALGSQIHRLNSLSFKKVLSQLWLMLKITYPESKKVNKAGWLTKEKKTNPNKSHFIKTLTTFLDKRHCHNKDLQQFYLQFTSGQNWFAEPCQVSSYSVQPMLRGREEGRNLNY